MKYNYIIGIDPDLHKSGLAIYDTNKKSLVTCEAAEMWYLFECLYIYNDLSVLIRLEYPSNTNTWHRGGKGAALNVGKNQAVAIIIKEFLDSIGANYELIAPAGYSKLFDNEETFKRTTGWILRTNKDARAAAAMCWR